ncbi:MAG TPA: HAD family hydrolase [Chloroflexota bacterium]|nr:HAD family hydrolase [Chloroflexota bacterium]
MTAPRLVVLFDVDGTLIATEGRSRHSRAFTTAFEMVYGVPCRFTSALHGMTDMQIFRHVAKSMGLDDDRGSELAREACRRMVEVYGVADPGDGRYIMLPGVRETLERLVAEGALLGLVTGNPPEIAEHKLSSVGVNDYFRFGAFGTEAEDRGELPPLAIRRAEELIGESIPPQEVFVIGDTPRDIACAQESSCRSVAVATGMFAPADLEPLGPDLVLPDLSDQSKLWRMMGIEDE